MVPCVTPSWPWKGRYLAVGHSGALLTFKASILIEWRAQLGPGPRWMGELCALQDAWEFIYVMVGEGKFSALQQNVRRPRAHPKLVLESY